MHQQHQVQNHNIRIDYSLALKIINLLRFLSEMKKILIFGANLLMCIGIANAAVRDGTSITRTKTEKNTPQQTQSRISTTPVRTTTARTTTLSPRGQATQTRTQSGTRVATSGRGGATATKSRTATNRNFTPVVARATDTGTFSMSETRVGAEYEQCKNTYFSCMDQFCSLKNDDYRRCSCNDRVFKLAEKRAVLTDAGEQLTVFTENLDVVGMTAAQAASMRNESEGETALTRDNSASKALLQAIMNSIRGEDSNVGGKFSDLNSITISFDTTNAFGMADIGQAVAAYNGNALYSAVYPQCRNAVRADCNNASLQRAITAYLMAIEQDCNTVQSAIENTQKQMKAAVREGSAMLDLARVENRKKHNSSDITTCINEVESAILSEEVCGKNYHKCLDNGEYIDIATGKPIIGVEDFYKLEQLLTFRDGIEAADQKLAQQNKNRIFVNNFEKRTKKFAAGALDKCRENADTVWAEYLDKAMLEIYYAQRDKVREIKQGCFEYISTCYANNEAALNSATSSISPDNLVVLHPDTITLTNKTCLDYINSCDNMFDNNIIKEYVENMKDTDTLTACRAVVKQCFDRYGGTNYENFYYPYSGLFDKGRALDWFTLYEQDNKTEYVSDCAKQLQNIAACNKKELIEKAFGGLNRQSSAESTKYGMTVSVNGTDVFGTHEIRPSGVATEVFNQIISILTTQCTNLQGRFVEPQNLKSAFHSDQSDPCKIMISEEHKSDYKNLTTFYAIANTENICPREYGLGVDVLSWGSCSCWENGGRRSKNGRSVKCMAALPVQSKEEEIKDPDGNTTTKTIYANDAPCSDWELISDWTKDKNFSENSWCTQVQTTTQTNQVCPIGATAQPEGCSNCCTTDADGNKKCEPSCPLSALPKGM